MNNFIRIWQELDVDEIKKNLLIVGDLAADCGNCREIGLKYFEIEKCPSCGTIYKYVTFRADSVHSASFINKLRKLRQQNPNLIFVNYEDYKYSINKKAANNLF